MPTTLHGSVRQDDEYGYYYLDINGKNGLSDIFQKYNGKDVVVTISIKPASQRYINDTPDGCRREAQRF